MLPDLSNILAWKPRRYGAAAGVDKAFPTKPAKRDSASERAMTATSQQDADEASETESAASSQSGGYLFRRQQSTQKTDDEDESDDNNDEFAKPAGANKHQQQQAAPSLRAVYSFARAGLQNSRMLLNKTRGAPSTASAAYYQQQPPASTRAPASRRKPHSRSVDELSESDFLPLATGTRVSTPFGLGTVLEVRARDGVTVVRLQRSHPNAVAAPATLFLRGDDDDCHAVPALVNDLVVTPAGNARVLSYDPHDQFYDVCVEHSGSIDAEYTCRVRASDVRRRNAAPGAASRPARRMRFHSMESHDTTTTSARSGRNSSSGAAPPKLARGLSTALRTVVATSSSVSTSTMNFLSNKYYQGQPVITKFGAGTIVALLAGDESATGNSGTPASGRILQVELEWGAVAFLRADAITSYPKALVGMDVSTKFGAGVVLELRAEDAIYTVRLHEEQPVGTSDIVYVHESDLHRVGKLAATVGSVHKQVRGKLSALAQRLGHERVVVMHLRDDEISSAGI